MSKNITISDVADALGVSKTTVSRAISGKGRIGESTRQKVLAYIEEYGYTPNVIAKGLAQSKTYNLCLVMPGNCSMVDLPFFQEAMMGVQDVAGQHAYDILLCTCTSTDISSLERIILNRKVDGVILLQTYVKDLQIEYLTGKKIPFVTIGSTNYEHVHQVDHDHYHACKELTAALLGSRLQRPALLGGNERYVVNQSRKAGFEAAFDEAGMKPDASFVYLNLEDHEAMNQAVEDALAAGADGILCMDDAICIQVLRKLRQLHVKVPQQVKVASFYNSSILENNIPSITSLSFDARLAGAEACKNVLGQVEEEEAEARILLPYEVLLNESTENM